MMKQYPMAHRIKKPREYREAVDTDIRLTYEKARAELAKDKPATVRQFRGKSCSGT
jgi:hypothetical protein